MRLWLKVLWVIATVFNVASLVWFLIGVTANFQRGLDLVGTVILIQVWIPSLIFTVLSIRLLIKKWIPPSGIVYASGVMLFLLFSVYLIQSVNTQGWLTKKLEVIH